MNKWVSVEDRLPENNLTVIVPGGIAYRRHDDWYTLTGERYPGRLIIWEHGVKHWMPLPEPPPETTNT